MKKYSISAFFPAYHDEKTIELMVDRLRKILPKLTDDYEIIIVDDCSPDKSGEIADKLAKKYKFIKVIHHSKNKGYGGALKSGFNASTKDLVFYTDGDAQYDVRELPNLYKYIDKYDIVTGNKIKRADKFYRILVSKIHYKFIRFIFGIKVKDISGDFRLFKKYVLDKVKFESNSGTICLEMIKKLQSAGFSIKEVPVHHYSRISGESTYFNIIDIYDTFREIAPLWWKLVVKKIFSTKRL